MAREERGGHAPTGRPNPRGESQRTEPVSPGCRARCWLRGDERGGGGGRRGSPGGRAEVRLQCCAIHPDGRRAGARANQTPAAGDRLALRQQGPPYLRGKNSPLSILGYTSVEPSPDAKALRTALTAPLRRSVSARLHCSLAMPPSPSRRAAMQRRRSVAATRCKSSPPRPCGLCETPLQSCVRPASPRRACNRVAISPAAGIASRADGR